MNTYTVQQVDNDPPKFILLAPDGARVARPVTGEEGKQRYTDLAEFANEVRRRALEERQ